MIWLEVDELFNLKHIIMNLNDLCRVGTQCAVLNQCVQDREAFQPLLIMFSDVNLALHTIMWYIPELR